VPILPAPTTEAIGEELLDHIPPAILATSVAVAPTHTAVGPLIVGTGSITMETLPVIDLEQKGLITKVATTV